MGEVIAVNDLSANTVLKLLESGTNGSVISLPKQDSVDVSRRIAARDFEATSADELFGGSQTISTKDFLNRPFQLRDVEFLPSDVKDSPLPFFALLHVVDMQGEMVTLSSGAATIVRKAAVAKAKGFLPVWLKILERPETEAGYRPLDFVKVPSNEQPF